MKTKCIFCVVVTVAITPIAYCQEEIVIADQQAKIEKSQIDNKSAVDPSIRSDASGVSIVIHTSPSDLFGHRAYRIINNSRESISYWGYSSQSPWYRVQKLEDGKWSEIKVGWFCGTGLQVCTVAPMQSAIFSVNSDYLDGTARAGIDLVDTKDASGDTITTVWSQPYAR